MKAGNGAYNLCNDLLNGNPSLVDHFSDDNTDTAVKLYSSELHQHLQLYNTDNQTDHGNDLFDTDDSDTADTGSITQEDTIQIQIQRGFRLTPNSHHLTRLLRATMDGFKPFNILFVSLIVGLGSWKASAVANNEAIVGNTLDWIIGIVITLLYVLPAQS